MREAISAVDCLCPMLRGSELFYFGVLLALHRIPEIPVELESKSKLRGHSQYPGQSERRIGGDATSSFNNLIEAGKGNTESHGKV